MLFLSAFEYKVSVIKTERMIHVKKFKKIVALCLTAVMSIGCLCFSASAASNPDYLYDGVDYYSENSRANYAPGLNPDVVLLPNDSDSFSYNFSNYSKQYSDFVISPQTTTTGIRMYFEATSNSHNLTMKVIRKDTGTVVYSDTVTVLKGVEQEFWLSFTYLEKGRGYYIELSNPTISGAAGTFTITD